MLKLMTTVAGRIDTEQCAHEYVRVSMHVHRTTQYMYYIVPSTPMCSSQEILCSKTIREEI